MWKTTLKIIFRNWWRNKTFTLIAILSLTTGIAFTNLLGAFVAYEYGIEKLNPNKNRMIWAMQDLPAYDNKKVAYMSIGAVKQIKSKYPEVVDYLQINGFNMKSIEVNGQQFEPIELLTVNSSFPSFFPFELLSGSWDALNHPQSIIISEQQAVRLFGTNNALGKQMTIIVEMHKETTFTVGAVVKNREQSAVVFDALINNGEDALGSVTLLMMAENTDIHQFEEKVKKDKIPTLAGGDYSFLTLDESISSTYNDQELFFWHCRKEKLLFVGLISAIMVFLIAIFNYVNIGYTRMLQQIKTIHTQKLMNANTRAIHQQLFADTSLMVFISFLFSLLLMYDILPLFNSVVSAEFTPAFFYSRAFFPFFVLFLLIFTVVPALFISKKISRLSGSDYRLFTVKKRNRQFGVSVTLQFIIALVLIIAMITANRQMQLVNRAGCHYHNLIEVVTEDIDKAELVRFEKKVKGLPGVEDISWSNMPLMNSWIMHSRLQKENGETLQSVVLKISGDKNLFHILKLNQLEGSDWNTLSDTYAHGVFVNKRFADLIGKSPVSLINEPLRKYFYTADSLSVIAGVVDNLHFNSLEENMMALIVIPFSLSDETSSIMRVRLTGVDNRQTIRMIRQLWEKTYPDKFFTYIDVFDRFLKRNHKITSMTHLLKMYSLISLLLVCFGLFGITFYAVRRRTKEIGIRKINGAKTHQILWLLLKPIGRWLAIALIVAVPLAWWFVERWLQQFAYRVELSFWDVFAALCIVSAIALLTVLWHTWLTAKSNPVDSLRAE